MEKRTPHYPLTAIKAAVAERGADCFTRTALHGVCDMGLTIEQAIASIQGLAASHFYKSMTTFADHRVWQDVYHAPTPNGVVYAKFTLRDDGSIVISFKELEP